MEEEEEPAAPAQHMDTHPHPGQPAVEEELVVSKGPENSNGQIHRGILTAQITAGKELEVGMERETVPGKTDWTHLGRVKKNTSLCVFRWLETQINRKTRWMTNTRRKERTRCVTR